MSEQETVEKKSKGGCSNLLIILVVISFFPIVVPVYAWTRKDWGVRTKVIITILCAIFLLFVIISSEASEKEIENQKAAELTLMNEKKKKATDLVAQAELLIADGEVDEAKKLIEKSKGLNNDKGSNTAFKLEEELNKLNSDDFLKLTMVSMSDSDFNLLVNGELGLTYIEHPAINSLFLMKLQDNKEKRTQFIAEEQQRLEEKRIKEEEERLQAEKDARKDLIESKFSIWNGEHTIVSRAIKDSMNNPDSYKHVETRYTDMGDYILVVTTFRGENAFGGTVTNTARAEVTIEGEILSLEFDQ